MSIVASLFLGIGIAMNIFEGASGEHAGVVTQPDPKTESDPPRPELPVDNGYGNLFGSRATTYAPPAAPSRPSAKAPMPIPPLFC